MTGCRLTRVMADLALLKRVALPTRSTARTPRHFPLDDSSFATAHHLLYIRRQTPATPLDARSALADAFTLATMLHRSVSPLSSLYCRHRAP